MKLLLLLVIIFPLNGYTIQVEDHTQYSMKHIYSEQRVHRNALPLEEIHEYFNDKMAFIIKEIDIQHTYTLIDNRPVFTDQIMHIHMKKDIKRKISSLMNPHNKELIKMYTERYPININQKNINQKVRSNFTKLTNQYKPNLVFSLKNKKVTCRIYHYGLLKDLLRQKTCNQIYKIYQERRKYENSLRHH